VAPRSHKQVGTSAESAVRAYLEHHLARRIRLLAPAGAKDCGDLDGVPDTVIQVKRCKALALASWVDEAKHQAVNAGKPLAVVVHWRRGKGDPGDWYVTMPLSTFVAGWKP
jgi:hypothetical protein